METFEAIKNRHSYRGKYKPVPVPREDLTKILEAGMAAPSGCNFIFIGKFLVRIHNIIL